MALQLGDDGICGRCRRVVPLRQLSGKGLCGACAASERAAPEMAMAASLDMEAIVRDIVEAGLMDRLRRKKQPAKDPLQIIEETIALTQGAAEKTEEQGSRDVQKGVAAPWKELRRRFPKK